jgi:hypothetical protein
MALAISTGQSYLDIRDRWDDREVDTAWALIQEANRKAESRGRRGPGAGGPQYSG